MNINLGQVVYSKAGRDKGRKFIVIEILDESFVLVTDGDLRRIEKPKKKKIKHLELTKEIVEPINMKLNKMIKVTNAEIRKTLAVLENNKEDSNDDVNKAIQ